MKLLPIIALFVPFAAGLYAAPLDVPSTIDSVTVYKNVARVTRTFEVDLAAGQKVELRFSGLPQGVNSSYVQVSAIDGAALNFGIVTFDGEYKDADKSQVLKDLEAKVRMLEAKKDALSNERRAISAFADSRVNLVASINKGLAETGKPELYELSKTAYDDASAAAKDAFTKLAAMDEAVRLVADEITVAREAANKQLQKEQATCAEYMVEAVSQGGKTKGTISYYVDGPSWGPNYIVKADTTKGSVNVSYLAKVTQQTGEDWNNVALYLETSRPGAGAKPEEPNAIFLNQIMRRAGYGVASKSMDSDAMYEMSASSKVAAPQAMAGNAVSVSSSLTGFNAQIKDRVNVLSADNATVLPLMERDIACEFHTETIPLTAQTAFLIGKIKNAFTLPMLAGSMQAIVDGSTNGEGVIEETLPGEEVVIGLGVNQNVVVERKIVAEKGKNSGILGGKRVEERNYINTITNHMSIPQLIVVRDRVPISKDEKIEVKFLRPENAKPDTETGLFDQEVTLKPGEKIELPTVFKVAYPSDWTITGGF